MPLIVLLEAHLLPRILDFIPGPFSIPDSGFPFSRGDTEIRALIDPGGVVSSGSLMGSGLCFYSEVNNQCPVFWVADFQQFIQVQEWREMIQFP